MEEKRTKHALIIDRSKNARVRYSNFNDEYKSAPNRSDVVDYDTKGKSERPPQEARIQEKPNVSQGEYIPTPSEKARLTPYFHKLSPIEQHKDLLTTRNVARNKETVSKWKQNPKAHDIRGIDTQPEELIKARLEVVRRHSRNPEVIIKNFNWRSREGVYSYSRFNQEGAGLIRLKRNVKNLDRNYAHELGHAYDRNVLSGMIGYTKGVGNMGYKDFLKKPKLLNDENLSFGKINNKLLEITDYNKRAREKIVSVTENKINPYNRAHAPMSYIMYRRSSQELFADWFSGLITDKPVIKRESKQFYNMFKKSNKPLFSDLRKSDYAVTKKYIKGSIF